MLRIKKIKKGAEVQYSTLPAFKPIGGNWWRLEGSFTVYFNYTARSSTRRGRLVIKSGFATDFASIPRLVWSVLAPWDYQYTPACLPHDLGYEEGGKLTLWTENGVNWVPSRVQFTRKAIDDLMYWGMLARGTPKWKANTIYASVRAWGWLAWRKAKKRDRDGGYRPDEAPEGRGLSKIDPS